MNRKYEKSVFINCPFDAEYKPIFDALVFVIHDAGLFARSARDISNGAQNRYSKILNIIAECKYGIHDISRTEPDKKYSLPRFNMPLELGIYLGCKSFGTTAHQRKSCLILDRVAFRYQKFMSDIAGQDISHHNNNPRKAIRAVRDWLSTESGRSGIPGELEIWKRYLKFQQDLPAMCKVLKTQVKKLTFSEFRNIVQVWIDNFPA